MTKNEKKPQTDREMILSPDSWSRWPLLPLKRPQDMRPNCGLVVGDPVGDTVYFVPNANIWRPDQEKINTTGRVMNVDDLLKEGWVID